MHRKQIQTLSRIQQVLIVIYLIERDLKFCSQHICYLLGISEATFFRLLNYAYEQFNVCIQWQHKSSHCQLGFYKVTDTGFLNVDRALSCIIEAYSLQDIDNLLLDVRDSMPTMH